MSEIGMTRDSRDAMFGVPRKLALAVAVGVIAAAVLTAAGTFGWFDDESDSTGSNFREWAVDLVAIVIAAAIVLWFGARAWRSAGFDSVSVAALVFGALALVSFPAFWLGIYGPWAAGGVALGVEAHQRGVIGGRRIMAYAGIVLAVVGFVFNALLNLTG